MRPPMKQLKKAAQRFLDLQEPAHAPADLPALLALTCAHLSRRFGLETQEAHDIALAVWSEIEGARSRCYVDLELSTPHLIFLVDPVAGVRRPIPTVDLVRMLGPRAVASSSEGLASG